MEDKERLIVIEKRINENVELVSDNFLLTTNGTNIGDLVIRLACYEIIVDITKKGLSSYEKEMIASAKKLLEDKISGGVMRVDNTLMGK